MKSKKAMLDKKLQKKFEVGAAHMGKCFELISKVFSDVYNGNSCAETNFKAIEKLERSAKFFRSNQKTKRFYKVPGFFYFIRSKLSDAKTLKTDFKIFENVCREHWNIFTLSEKRSIVKNMERLRRLRQSINGFSLFSDPEDAEKKF